MVRVFSTHFPLDSDTSIEKFLEIGKEWIVGSPHTNFMPEDINPLKVHGDKAEREGYYFEIGRVKHPKGEAVGINYTNPDARGVAWNTKVVASKQKTSFSTSISIDYESPGVKLKLPQCNRPYLIKLLLERIGGGMDCDLEVKARPFYIADGRGDECFVADMLNGSAKSVMPVVYVSRDTNNLCLVNTDNLAFHLAGVAHVLVEPSRDFSVKLREQTGGKNVYNGAIGVYWSDGYDRFFWLPEIIQAQNDPAATILHKVAELLNSRRMPKELTWENLQSMHNIQVIENMKSDHAGNLDGLLETYSSQLNLTEHQLKEAEERNSRLEGELRTARFSKPTAGGLIPDPQIPQIYRGEVTTILSAALKNAGQQTYPNSRRAGILAKIADSLSASPEAREEITDKIKQMFRDYKRMTAPIRNELERMGFAMTEDGPHYKLVLAGEPDGLCVTLPKTPSDHRSGKNTAAQIINTFF